VTRVAEAAGVLNVRHAMAEHVREENRQRMWLWRTMRRLVTDECGSTMSEFAIVMTVLTISMMVAFNVIGLGVLGNTNANQQNLSNSSLVAP